jgi:hypothetical protein
MTTTKLRFGFRHKGKRTGQLALFLIWREWHEDGDVVFARVLFQWWPRWLQRRDGVSLRSAFSR